MPQRVIIEQFKLSGSETAMFRPLQKLLDKGGRIVSSSSATIQPLGGTSLLYVTFVVEVPTSSK
jgi:hypothetical protein